MATTATEAKLPFDIPVFVRLDYTGYNRSYDTAFVWMHFPSVMELTRYLYRFDRLYDLVKILGWTLDWHERDQLTPGRVRTSPPPEIQEKDIIRAPPLPHCSTAYKPCLPLGDSDAPQYIRLDYFGPNSECYGEFVWALFESYKDYEKHLWSDFMGVRPQLPAPWSFTEAHQLTAWNITGARPRETNSSGSGNRTLSGIIEIAPCTIDTRSMPRYVLMRFENMPVCGSATITVLQKRVWVQFQSETSYVCHKASQFLAVTSEFVTGYHVLPSDYIPSYCQPMHVLPPGTAVDLVLA